MTTTNNPELAEAIASRDAEEAAEGYLVLAHRGIWTTTASARVKAGQPVEVTGDHTAGPARQSSKAVIGEARADTTPRGPLALALNGDVCQAETADQNIAAGDQLMAADGRSVARRNGRAKCVGVALAAPQDEVVLFVRN